MMVPILFLCIFIAPISYAADPSKKDISLTLRFPDDNDKIDDKDKIIETTTAQIAWSATIKNAVDDLGVEAPIPVFNVQTQIFKCLSVMVPWCHEKGDISFRKFKNNIAMKLLITPYAHLNKRNLLIQGNYLDVCMELKQLLAAFYADTLTNNKPNISTHTIGNKTILSFDDLPHELEPLVAGALLHNLLIHQMYTHVKIKKCPMPIIIDDRPCINNSSARNGFTAVWEQTVEPGNNQFCTTEHRFAFFDATRKEEKISSTVINIELNENTQCAVSSDGNHMLIHGCHIWSGRCKHAALYYVPQRSGYKNLDKKIQKVACPYNTDELITLLFDDVHNLFHLITCKKSTDKTKNFCFCSVDPTRSPLRRGNFHTMTSTNENDFFFKADKMSWSCVNGSLVGIRTHDETIYAILYKDKELREARFNTEKKLWTYFTDDGKEHDADFTTLPVGAITDAISHHVIAPSNHAIAVQRSFIPNFENLIMHTPLTDTTHALAARFDPDNLCFHHIKRGTPHSPNIIATTERPFPRKLIIALQMLNRRWLNGDPTLLVDAYALYHHYMHRNNWDSFCKDLHTHISSHLIEIFAKKVKKDSCITS